MADARGAVTGRSRNSVPPHDLHRTLIEARLHEHLELALTKIDGDVAFFAEKR